MQGWAKYIPVEIKAKYLNLLLKVGFDTLDCGSFVSAKAVPQMADTGEVLKLLEPGHLKTKLMVLVGNTRGGLMAASHSKIDIIAYPYSVSPTFLKRNLNTSQENAWKTITELQAVCGDSGKDLRVYVTMAFGNPYRDSYSEDLVLAAIDRLVLAGVEDLVLSDITGEGTADSIGKLCAKVVQSFPGLQTGIHLHSRTESWQNKTEAAWNAGIRSFESALGGIGGCPMTGYELLANLDTVELAGWCRKMNIPVDLDEGALCEAQRFAPELFIL